MRIFKQLFLITLVFVSLSGPGEAQQQDAETGLIMADGWQAVRGNCVACHSAQMITQNSGTAAVWISRIRWMQETQGLRILEPELEATIVEYLSTHYGQREAGRRAPLPADLMPANPYATDE